MYCNMSAHIHIYIYVYVYIHNYGMCVYMHTHIVNNYIDTHALSFPSGGRFARRARRSVGTRVGGISCLNIL